MSKIDENHSSLHFPLQLSLVKMEMVSQSEYEGFFVFCNVMEGRKERKKEGGLVFMDPGRAWRCHSGIVL